MYTFICEAVLIPKVHKLDFYSIDQRGSDNAKVWLAYSFCLAIIWPLTIAPVTLDLICGPEKK
jgi:hypothetical protein